MLKTAILLGKVVLAAALLQTDGQDGDLARLTSLLENLSQLPQTWSSSEVRKQEAYQAIFSMGPKAFPLVKNRLKTAEVNAQKISLAFLVADWNVADSQAMAELTRLMSDGDAEVRAVAASILSYDDMEASSAILARTPERDIRASKDLPVGRGAQGLTWLTDDRFNELIRNSLAFVGSGRILEGPNSASIKSSMMRDLSSSAGSILSLVSRGVRESGRGHSVLLAVLEQVNSDDGRSGDSLGFKIGLLAEYPYHSDKTHDPTCTEDVQIGGKIVEALRRIIWSSADPYVLARCFSVLSRMSLMGGFEPAIQELDKLRQSHSNPELRSMAELTLNDVKNRPKSTVESPRQKGSSGKAASRRATDSNPLETAAPVSIPDSQDSRSWLAPAIAGLIVVLALVIVALRRLRSH